MRPTTIRATRRAASLSGEPQGLGAHDTKDSRPAAPKTAPVKPAATLNVRDEIRRQAVEAADAWASDAARWN